MEDPTTCFVKQNQEKCVPKSSPASQFLGLPGHKLRATAGSLPWPLPPLLRIPKRTRSQERPGSKSTAYLSCRHTPASFFQLMQPCMLSLVSPLPHPPELSPTGVLLAIQTAPCLLPCAVWHSACSTQDAFVFLFSLQN